MKNVIGAAAYTLIYTAFMLVLFKIQGAKHQLYNYVFFNAFSLFDALVIDSAALIGVIA